MSDDIRSSTCCPSDTPDAQNGDGIWDYQVDRNDAHPPPALTCPDDFVAWLQDGEYIVPDFSSAITINGLCAVDSEFTITQQPPAGTVISIGGEVVILIVIIDGHANEVTCSFTIDIHDPENPDDPDPPTIIPPWIYAPHLFLYYSANDSQCTAGATDGDPPCWFRRDLSEFFGNATPRHLSNGGAARLERSESPVQGFSPGPTFHRGSVWSNSSANGYLYRADDTFLRLIGQSFTLRGFFKLAQLDAMNSWHLFGKFSSVGYRFIVRRPSSAAEYLVVPELQNDTAILTTTAQLVPVNTWIYVAMVFDAATGQLRFYRDGLRVADATSTGFVLSGEASQFRIGSGDISGAGVLACWPLDDTAWEDSAGGRHLTPDGTVNNVAGKIDNCAQFPTNGKLKYMSDSQLGLVGTDWSVRLWARVTSVASNPGVIIGRHNGATGWRMRITGPVIFNVDFQIDASSPVQASTALVVNTWYHIVATYDVATTTLRIYRNGVLDATAVRSAPSASGAEFYIGSESSGPVEIDEVVIFDKELTGAEVITDYAAGAGTSCPAESPSIANVYHDEIGLWLQAWSDARIAGDYAILHSFA